MTQPQGTQSQEFSPTDETSLPAPTEYLSPEQRADAIAEILATIALRALKQSHETTSSLHH